MLFRSENVDYAVLSADEMENVSEIDMLEEKPAASTILLVEQGSFEHAWREKLQGKVKPASNNDNIANAILSSVVPDAATKAEFDASEQKNREEFALICRLGDMEHDRWLAYCQATGMTELGHGTVEQEREQRMRAAVVEIGRAHV